MIGRTLSQYRIESQLGAGGMGVVYGAYDTRLERKVALKVVGERFTDEPTARERLMREARSAAALNHPHICTVHEVGEAEGQVYIVMEYVEGRSLSALEGGPEPVDAAVRYGIQIADALAHAHDRGIIHRDLKAGNVIVTAEGRAKVLDFGLAKRLPTEVLQDQETKSQDSLTEAGQIVGTLHYMAPELLRGQPADARSDIWALGVLLYEMAVGDQPFRGRTRFEVTHAIMGDPVPPLPANVPPALRAVIQRCLAKERGERYQGAREVRAALEAIQSGSSTLPAEVVRLRPARLLWTLAAAGLLLGATGATYWWFHGRARGIESIAVLPFANVGGNPDNEYLSDGIAENVIGSLSQLSGLKVIGFSSVTGYRDRDTDPRKIGAALGVQALVTGRVEQRGDTLSIRADLVSVADGRELWGQRFDGKAAALISLQDDVAGQIIANLQPRLTREERKRAIRHATDDAEAYKLYMRGLYFHNKEGTPEDYSKALDYYRQAVDKDPGYALAYSGMADLYASMAFTGVLPPKEAHQQAEAAVRKAVSIDESLPEVQVSKAVFAWTFDWDWAAAETSCQRAMQLSPNNNGVYFFCGQCSRALGRFDEAIARLKKAEELDPLTVERSRAVATTYYWARQYDLAVAQARRALYLAPKDSLTHDLLADVYARQGRKEEAVAELQQTFALAGDAESAESLGQDFQRLGYERVVMQVNQGTLDSFKEQAKSGYVSPFTFGWIYAKLGDADQAFAWLDRAYEERAPWLTYIKTDPAFDGLRSDRRFGDLLRRIGLPQ
jgi:serine/threonine protein kinase/Tfp pilus assembly protein PilF